MPWGLFSMTSRSLVAFALLGSRILLWILWKHFCSFLALSVKAWLQSPVGSSLEKKLFCPSKLETACRYVGQILIFQSNAKYLNYSVFHLDYRKIWRHITELPQQSAIHGYRGKTMASEASTKFFKMCLVCKVVLQICECLLIFWWQVKLWKRPKKIKFISCENSTFTIHNVHLIGPPLLSRLYN